jgi:hypothetical protein
MDMQDKAFDDVFRNKLDGFETEPSAKVWVRIDKSLDEKNRRKAIRPWLSIAAGIAVLISAGIWFIPKNTAPGHGQKTGIAKNTVQLVLKHAASTPVKRTPSTTQASPQLAVNRIEHAAVQIQKQVYIKPAQDLMAKEPLAGTVQNDTPQPVLAVVTPKPEQLTKPVVPGPETPLTVKQTDHMAAPDQQNMPALIAEQQPPLAKTTKAISVKKHGIHNFGDLVNLVVAKVDKRKDKALEFTDDDEDESTLTAVNIGPLKIKKEDKAER